MGKTGAQTRGKFIHSAALSHIATGTVTCARDLLRKHEIAGGFKRGDLRFEVRRNVTPPLIKVGIIGFIKDASDRGFSKVEMGKALGSKSKTPGGVVNSLVSLWEIEL